MREISVIVFLLLVSGGAVAGTGSSWQSCVDSDRNLVSGRYHAEDFPESEMREPGQRTSEFPAWAARVANGAVSLCGAEDGFNRAIAHVARARAILAIEMGERPTSGYGVRRPRWSGNHFPSPGIGPLVKIDGETQGARLALVDLIRAHCHRHEKGREPGTTIGTNTYTDLSGESHEASRIFEDRGWYNAQIPLPWNREIIMTDVFARLEAIESHRDTWSHAEKMKHFAIAMYGYYNAMPYQRGSAAIGRIFFAAAYRHLFGKKIPGLPPAIDVHALVLQQKDFEDAFIPVLSN